MHKPSKSADIADLILSLYRSEQKIRDRKALRTHLLEAINISADEAATDAVNKLIGLAVAWLRRQGHTALFHCGRLLFIPNGQAPTDIELRELEAIRWALEAKGNGYLASARRIKDIIGQLTFDFGRESGEVN